MVSTADEPEQPFDQAGQTPSADPSITPSAPAFSGRVFPQVMPGGKGGASQR